MWAQPSFIFIERRRLDGDFIEKKKREENKQTTRSRDFPNEV